MAPTEAEILSHYLLQPAPLTAITTFEQFRALFPQRWQDSPAVRSLFRDLRSQRNAAVDAVAENVAIEARRGAAMKREVLRQRLEEERQDDDAEIELERALFGNKSGGKRTKHTLQSIVDELEGAAGALEDEIEHLEDEEVELASAVREKVQSLGNLRYGNLTNSNLRDDVVEGLGSLQEACQGKI